MNVLKYIYISWLWKVFNLSVSVRKELALTSIPFSLIFLWANAFQQQFLHSDFLQLFHKKLLLIQLKSMELFPWAPADIHPWPKSFKNQRRSLCLALEEHIQRVE